MKVLVVASTLLLGGCACLPNMRPQSHVVPHHRMASVPVIVPPPVVPETTKPATFKQRFRRGFGKIKWLHH